MKISTATESKILADLAEGNAGYWQDVYSEIHGEGDEFHLWFQVDGPEAVPDILQLVQARCAHALETCDETAFDLAFHELRKDEKIIWDYIDDDDLRVPFAEQTREFGKRPHTYPLDEYEIFSAAWRKALSRPAP